MSALALPEPEQMIQPELSEDAKTFLLDAAKSILKKERTSRIEEVILSRRQRYYERGDQHIWKDRTQPVLRPASEGEGQLPKYMGVYNIYRPYERSLIAVLSQNPPGINFKADDLTKSVDIAASKVAERMRHAVDRDVHMKSIQTRAARFFCTDARVVIWTRVGDDGKVLSSVHGVLESRVPIYTADLKEWPYAILSRELDVDLLKDKYPDIEGDISAGTNNAESWERIARLGVLGGTSRGGSNTEADLATEHNVWLRPSRYRKATQFVKQELLKLYPNGVHYVLVSEGVTGFTAESMDDCLAVAFPSEGDGQNRPSLLRDLLDLQDRFNDTLNQIAEILDYCIPAKWFNSNVVDGEAIAQQKAEPGTWNPADPPNGMAMSEAFYEEAPAILPEGTMEYVQQLMGEIAQFITGALPSLFGAGTPDSETASGQEALRNQAMGGLSTAWAAMQWLFARVYEQGVKAKAQVGQATIETDAGSDTIDSTALLVGSFSAYPDEDSSFPETAAAKRTAFNTISQQLGALPGGDAIISHPDNLRLGAELNGLMDYTIPQVDAAEKQQREIEQLLAQSPLPPDPQAQMQWQQQAQMQGQPPPAPPQPTTSILVDEDWDFHQFELDTLQEWLSSDARVEEDRKGNTQGILNVKLHGLAHRAALQKQTPPPQGKPPSVSINANLLPPEGLAQAAQEAGINITPDSIQEQQGMNDAKAAAGKVIQ